MMASFLNHRVKCVISALPIDVALFSFFKIFKRAKNYNLALHLDARNPSTPVFPPINSSLAAAIVRPSVNVLLLLGSFCKTEVFPRVIEPITINMVNFSGWPLPRHVKPCKPMRIKLLPIEGYHDPVFGSRTADYSAGVSAFAVRKPQAAKDPALRVIMHKALEEALVKMEAVHMRIVTWGQHPLSMGAGRHV